MGSVASGGSGCACPESALLRNLLQHMVLERNETVVVDMEAGLEHLGRGTAQGVDAFIVVIEPGNRSIETAKAVVKLAKDIGVNQVYAVINKVHPGQIEQIKNEIDFIPYLGYLPYDQIAVEADLTGRSLFELSPEFVDLAQTIKANLESARVKLID
jgi:CO dehydrogenase maturation factor